MAKANWLRGSAVLVLGAILGGLLVVSWERAPVRVESSHFAVRTAT
jgi:hypothetical protein